MVLIDTSGWIEYFAGSEIGKAIGNRIETPQNCLVPTLVQFELIKWMRRKHGDGVADSVLAYTQTCVVVPLDTQIAMAAVELSSSHHLAAADAIIYASARLTNSELVTCDAHFEGLPGVIYVSKKDS